MNTVWNWDAIYLTCFGVGLALSVIAFLLGAVHLHIGHFHFGHAHVGSKANSLSPVNGFTITAFLCWFGGAGYLMHHSGTIAGPLVLLFATLSGASGASLLMWFLAKVLMPHERTLEPADTEMTGIIGRVSCTVTVDGFGEMLFSQNGARRSVAVRSDSGAAIERDAEVIVMRYTRGIAYVRRWDEFEGGLMRSDSRPEEQESSMREP